MNFIGKILPVDGYYVLSKGNLPADYAKSLTHLYQPLIGMQAVMLYQTLLHEMELQMESAQTHHTLMNYLNVPLDEIYRARLKLEGIGLLKTYEYHHPSKNDEKYYLYELQCPFAPHGFFKDAMLSQLLYHHIGEKKFTMLKKHYNACPVQEKGQNVTVSFDEVFETFQPSSDQGQEMPGKQEEPAPQVQVINFSWMEQMLKQRMIPPQDVLREESKKLISQMSVLYHLTSHEIEKAVLWALTDENKLDADEFRAACHDLFKSQNKQASIQLAVKEEPQKETPTVKKPDTKEEQLIYELETISPKQLLEDLSSGNQASEQDMRTINEVMTTQGLPSPVMNVLIHYVLLQSNMKLSRAYLEKIASHWSRANLKTAKEAMAFAKRETEKYQKGLSMPKSRYRKQISNEVVPDWFKERKKQQQETTGKEEKSAQQATDEEKEKEEVLALLRKHSSKNQNNHLQG